MVSIVNQTRKFFTPTIERIILAGWTYLLWFVEWSFFGISGKGLACISILEIDVKLMWQECSSTMMVGKGNALTNSLNIYNIYTHNILYLYPSKVVQ